ncbi:hypothetical protein HYU14_00350 [Candidatus Woesearchaeota archaeon]|nr:hypothetical protein [Candidatus Woesearchaeota archaeon]
MSIFTILLFFLYTYGLGFSITFFFKNAENFFERHIMRVGIGLAVLPFLLVVLDIFRIPLDWKLVLGLSLAIPIYRLLKGRRGIPSSLSLPQLKVTRSGLNALIIFIIFVITFYMYSSGAFSYAYLEDDDPWAHAVGVKYVAMEKNFDDPENNLFYIKTYPPGYDGLLGILHQTSPSLLWTMKFFNALIISLGIFFFYYFAKNFMQSERKALYAALALAMLPSYLSHFIWAHSLVITQFIVSLYCIEMLRQEKRWSLPIALTIAGAAVVQPDQPIKFLVMYIIYFAISSIAEKKFQWRLALAVKSGYLLSLAWWGFNAGNFFSRFFSYNRARAGIDAAASSSLSSSSLSSSLLEKPLLEKAWSAITSTFPPNSGTATRAYTFNDFFVAKSQNLINNPIGIGIALSLLAVIGILLILAAWKTMGREKKRWTAIALFWLLFAFLGVNSLTFHLPVGLFAFRFWMLMAIPLSILAGEGIDSVARLGKGIGIPRALTSILLITALFFTGGVQKYAVNTAQWYPGQFWTSNEEIQGYVWLTTLPVNTKVFSYSNDEQVIGMDKFSCQWCSEVVEFRKGLLEKNISEAYPWLKQQNYEYVMVDGMTVKNFQAQYGNATAQLVNQKISEIASSGKFQPAFQNQGVVVFKVI